MFCENWKHRKAPPSQTEWTYRPPFPKISNTHTEWGDATRSQQASGDKAEVSNYEAYYSGNLPHIAKLTSSSHVHPFGIKNPKNHCFINVILQIIYSVWRSTQQKTHINNCVGGKISECLFDTAHKTTSAQEVETLKLQLSTYNSFFTGEIQEDACECLMLLIGIMGKGFGPCPTNDNINSKRSFSELLFSFVLFNVPYLLFLATLCFNGIPIRDQLLNMLKRCVKFYETCDGSKHSMMKLLVCKATFGKKSSRN